MTVLKRARLESIAVLIVLLAAWPAAAQEKPAAPSAEQQAMMDAMMKAATPGPNHELLRSLAGDWTFVMKMWSDPSAPPTETKGTVSSQPVLGGRYVESHYKAPVMGMPFEGVGLNGYDNVTGRFVSTWYDNMSTGIMYMTGSYDQARKAFTYTTELADPMSPSTLVKVRELIRLVDEDTHTMEMYETRGGKETKTMEIVFNRVK